MMQYPQAVLAVISPENYFIAIVKLYARVLVILRYRVTMAAGTQRKRNSF